MSDNEQVLSEGEMAELRRLESEATPRPWEYREVDDLCDIATPDGWISDLGDKQHLAVTKLFVAARNALPRLLASHDAMAQRVREQRDLLAAIGRYFVRHGEVRWVQIIETALAGATTEAGRQA